ncbi:MAG: heavy metal sensor histidine kinase [Gemmatimonadaceae bacterium]
MRWSLAAQLTAWYAATAFVLVAGTIVVQYRTLSRDLAGEDDQLLLETLSAARLNLPAPGAAPLGAAGTGPIVRTLDKSCRAVGVLSHRVLPPPDCSAPATGRPRFRSWRSPDGRNWRVVSQRISAAPPRTVEVLLDRWTDEEVLRGYRRQLAIVLPAALLLSVLLGSGIARRGLAPLRDLAARVRQIDARSLDRRLDVEGAPAEVQALVASFDDMLGRLHNAFAALSYFSADLAHEFRTPLHVLRQQAEVALGRARSVEEYREVLSSGLEELDRLRRMVDDTLFLARAEDPRASIERASLRLADELASVAEFMDALASDRAVTIAVDVPDALYVEADRVLLRRALVNLVTNAIRHTPAGGRVALEARPDDAAAVVRVRDTGVGISPEVLPRVFDRHFRGPPACTDRSEGAGLGLSIVRGVMTLHGGTAEVESEGGRGTCVTLRFPAAASGRGDPRTNLTNLTKL